MAVTRSVSSLECASKNNIPLVLSSLFSPFPFFLIPSPQTGHLSLSSQTKFPIKLSTRDGEKGLQTSCTPVLKASQCLAQKNHVVFSKLSIVTPVSKQIISGDEVGSSDLYAPRKLSVEYLKSSKGSCSALLHPSLNQACHSESSW